MALPDVYQRMLTLSPASPFEEIVAAADELRAAGALDEDIGEFLGMLAGPLTREQTIRLYLGPDAEV